MKTRLLVAVLVLLAPAVFLAETVGDGKWLRRVPDEDRVRVNPVAHQAQAAEAGKALFAQNCAKCHGADANGRVHPPPRPSLRSVRVRQAKDGEMFWMLTHGNPYLGMPQWSSLSEMQRWQIIDYLRTLPPGASTPIRKGSGSPM